MSDMTRNLRLLADGNFRLTVGPLESAAMDAADLIEYQAARIAELEAALGKLLEQVRKAKSPDVAINMRDWRVSMDNARTALKGQ